MVNGARYEEWWVNPPDYTGTLISGTAEVAFMVMCGCVCVFLCVTIANCYNRPRANAKETQC